jgi:hypothetical protein
MIDVALIKAVLCCGDNSHCSIPSPEIPDHRSLIFDRCGARGPTMIFGCGACWLCQKGFPDMDVAKPVVRKLPIFPDRAGTLFNDDGWKGPIN